MYECKQHDIHLAFSVYLHYGTFLPQTYQRPRSAGIPPSAFGHSTRSLTSTSTSSDSRKGSVDRGMLGLTSSRDSGSRSALYGSDNRYTLGPGSYNVQDTFVKKSFNVRASTARRTNARARASPPKPPVPHTQSVCSSPTGTYVSIFPLSQNRREVTKPDSAGGRMGFWSGPSSPGPDPTPPMLSTPNLKKYLAIKSAGSSSHSAPASLFSSPRKPVRESACVVASSTTSTTASVDDDAQHCANTATDHSKDDDNDNMSVYNAHLLNGNKSIDHDDEDDDKFYHTSLASAAVDEESNCDVPE